MTTTQNGSAPPTGAQAPELTPAVEVPIREGLCDIDILVETPEGFQARIVSKDIEPAKVSPWLTRTSRALHAAGYKPVNRARLPMSVSMAAPAAAAGGGSGPASGPSEATWIPGQNGAPPSCSLHGSAKWVPPGTFKPGHAKAGQTYSGFWSCNVRDCRPKGSAVPK